MQLKYFKIQNKFYNTNECLQYKCKLYHANKKLLKYKWRGSNFATFDDLPQQIVKINFIVVIDALLMVF